MSDYSEQDRIETAWSRALLALAVQKIASEYHSGAASKGYRKLCQAGDILKRLQFKAGATDPTEWPETRERAAKFLWRFRRTVASSW